MVSGDVEEYWNTPVSWIIPGINSSCNIQIDFFFVKKLIQNLAGRADLTMYVVHICKSRIAHMMVNADGLFRRSEIIRRYCQTVRSAYITGYKKIILSGSPAS